MRVRLDGSNASDQLVINGGGQPAKPGLRSQMSETVTSGGNLRTGYPGCGCTEWCHHRKKVFALSRPLQAGAFNYP